jgi:NAD(P)-dependent dehydrogenase (short-subunit alcohol dehydrogenase family)
VYNPLDLSGKLILVTGASSGIGRAISILLSRFGARLILAGRRAEALEDTLALTENGTNHLTAVFDLTDLDNIPRWVEEIVQRTGTMLDGAVHCAGVSRHIPIRALSRTNIESTMTANVHSALMLLRGVTSKKVAQTAGMSIVLISSAAALVASPGLTTYSASKIGLSSIARSAAKELAAKRIRVNCIAPAYVRTQMFDHASNTIPDFQRIVAQQFLGLIEPEEVAVMAAYLLSDAARRVTGAQFVIDGGFTL